MKQESERVTVLIKENKKVLERVEVHSEKIKILEEKSKITRETFRNLTETITVIEKRLEEEKRRDLL